MKGGRRPSSVTSPPRLHSIWNARPRPQLQAETRPLQSSENETLFCADASDAEPHLRRSRAKRGGIHTSSRPPPRRCTAVAWRVRWWRWIWRWWLRVSASSGPHVRAAREQRSADARAPRWRAAAPDSGEARRLYVYHIGGVGCGPGPARHTLLRAGAAAAAGTADTGGGAAGDSTAAPRTAPLTRCAQLCRAPGSSTHRRRHCSAHRKMLADSMHSESVDVRGSPSSSGYLSVCSLSCTPCPTCSSRCMLAGSRGTSTTRACSTPSRSLDSVRPRS